MNFQNISHFFIVKFCILLFGLQIVMAYSYPLDHLSDPWCEKGTHRNQMTEECKIDFEIPETSVNRSTKNSREKLMFSVLWKDSYQEPHAQQGGHPGLDIVSTIGTPVYSMTSGEVVRSEYSTGYGNVIVVRSDDGTGYHFSYAHLEKRLVKVGDRIKEGQNIGTVGRTGFTMGKRGYHLELQITTQDSPSHPYYFSDCNEVSYMEAVNTGVCNDLLAKYTINPMTWMRKNLNEDSYKPEYEEYTWKKELEIPVQVQESVEKNYNYNDILAKEVIIPLLEKNIPLKSDVIKDDVQENEHTKEGREENIKKEEQPQPSHSHTESSKMDTSSSGSNIIHGLHTSREIVPSSRAGYMDLVINIVDGYGNPVSGQLSTPLDIAIDTSIYSSYISTLKSIRNGKKVVKLKVL